ncbi:flagellar basal body P-ring formation chaperone FlgA [Segnochrobactrum spirostomi]|uniref:Flagella basal body P-ring formation protein FlgA n=1 Tax=Segnochrobactrum spirostomi TaxID=2608987 RepID=A0A6A7Y4Y9_9HYPH|nr:flagellar basal body P-ring formation chaperone FlgA [Segnochrobactrum spirostomi]MQT12759.1 flagellar basal body P-ring formation protein FlgA [Segnochrobactrum spirostomi]
MTAIRLPSRTAGSRLTAAAAAFLAGAVLAFAPAAAQTAGAAAETTGAMSMAQTMTVADTAAALAAQAKAAGAQGQGAAAAAAAPAVAPSMDAAPSAGTLPVPAVTIFPGDLIDDSMIVDSGIATGVDHAAVARDRNQIVGKVARRTLAAGKLIPLNGVADPKVISRGVAIEAVLEEGGLSITTLVMPLQDGAVGSLIQARNVDSGKVISGIVAADGTLRVGSMGGS